MRFLALALITLLPACATIVEGTTDNVTVTTTPAAATCTLDRNGQRVGAVPTTPGSVRVDKSHHAILVTCDREGYQTATTTVTSSFTGTTVGNVIAGGLIGIVVDMASGANSQYPAEVRLTLAENPRPAEAPAPVAMEPVDTTPIRPVSYQRRR